jgi:hypothetical protein
VLTLCHVLTSDPGTGPQQKAYETERLVPLITMTFTCLSLGKAQVTLNFELGLLAFRSPCAQLKPPVRQNSKCGVDFMSMGHPPQSPRLFF